MRTRKNITSQWWSTVRHFTAATQALNTSLELSKLSSKMIRQDSPASYFHREDPSSESFLPTQVCHFLVFRPLPFIGLIRSFPPRHCQFQSTTVFGNVDQMTICLGPDLSVRYLGRPASVIGPPSSPNVLPLVICLFGHPLPFVLV